jgi:tetratricopeptide (TPR) repeat protein
LSISPYFYLAAIALGDLFSEEGDIRAAASQSDLVGRLAPKSDTRALDASAFFVAYVLEDFQRALKMYRRLLDISPRDFVTQSNVAVLELMNESPNEILKPIQESLLQRHPVGGQAIIRAIQAMRIGDRSSALSNVAKIFADDNEKVFELYKGFLLLLLREAHREGWADLLLTMLDETGAADKNWPLRVAYEAYVHGAERLLDVNPEVRASARKILGLLSASGVRHAGEHVVSPKR